ncbi:hypothetical protein [Novipirellula caenicola]|uniref:Secreted protein n=1 Tax=Novipirellula caenicola TaxID=1536901 RepID=A0ABP9VLD8_9BACT
MNEMKHVEFRSKLSHCLASLLVAGCFVTTAGCGAANSGEGRTTEIEELNQFLDENPELRNTEPETSDLNSNEFEGITITREQV